ncbi:Sorbitol dehydrogenase [uncultured Clostridium sp.]|nr:Sorbitol dehydrogenase [uncultured Clostridium sp.]
MLSVVRYGLGKGEVELREVPIPQIGEGDVLLRVHSAGLCGSDINTYMGRGSGKTVPLIMGHEFAGTVAAVGRRVTRWKEGDRVVSDNTGAVCGSCYACMQGEYLQCPNRLGLGGAIDGGFAEYVRIPEQALSPFPNCLWRVPDDMPLEVAAILDPPSNGYNAVIQQGGLIAGETVAVMGVGPLGLGGIGAASAAGASKVIALVRASTSALHREAARKMGATHIIETDTQDARAEVLRLTDGEGVAITNNCAGPASTFPLCVDITRNGGKIVMTGYDWEHPLNHEITTMTDRNISLVGHMGYNPTSWRNVIRLIEAGKLDIRPMITHELPLKDFHEGVRLMQSRQAIKVIFHP